MSRPAARDAAHDVTVAVQHKPVMEGAMDGIMRRPLETYSAKWPESGSGGGPHPQQHYQLKKSRKLLRNWSDCGSGRSLSLSPPPRTQRGLLAGL